MTLASNKNRYGRLLADVKPSVEAAQKLLRELSAGCADISMGRQTKLFAGGKEYTDLAAVSKELTNAKQVATTSNAVLLHMGRMLNGTR